MVLSVGRGSQFWIPCLENISLYTTWSVQGVENLEIAFCQPGWKVKGRGYKCKTLRLHRLRLLAALHAKSYDTDFLFNNS